MDQNRIFFWTSVLFFVFLFGSKSIDADKSTVKVDFNRIKHNFSQQKSTDGDKDSPRKKRYLTFNNDQSNIRVEMVFAVPVLAIPIGGKDSQDEVPTFPTIDVNTKSILASGVIMFMLFFIIPTLVRLYFPMPSSSTSSSPHHRAEGRSEKGDIFQFISRLEDTFRAFNIDTGLCSQKAVCWIVSDAARRVATSNASSFDKVVDGISSFSWIQYMLEDLPYGEALTLGQSGECSYYDDKCSVTSNKIKLAANSLLSAIKKSKHRGSESNPLT